MSKEKVCFFLIIHAKRPRSPGVLLKGASLLEEHFNLVYEFFFKLSSSFQVFLKASLLAESMIDILLLVLCGMSCCALAKESNGKYSTPLLDVKVHQLVLEANQTLQLKCRGRGALHWVLPFDVSRSNQSLRVEHSRCRKQHCSTLTLSPALARHTGSYRCAYRHRQERHTAVYIYVTDSQRPFVKDQTEIPELLYLMEGKPLLFPCRVTTPDTSVSLVKFQAPVQTLVPDQKDIIWNSKEGFTIRSPSIVHTGMFYCEATLNGVKHKQHFLVYRPVYEIYDVYLNSTGPVQALQGDRLVLNCTATAPHNSRVNIRWSYPGEGLRKISATKRIERRATHVVFYSILTISQLRKYDRGVYVCHVRNDRARRTANTTVTVYDQPFIRLKHRNGSQVQALAGQRSFRLSPKIRAFPAPEIIWLKDGMVAAEKCSRYHMDGSSLVIRDVAENDAGVYTVLAGIQKFGLYQNLTISLVVNAKPQIGEKAVSVRDPGTVQRGSRHALRCTSSGVPPPQIQWLWHPCPPKGRCVPPPTLPPRTPRRVTSQPAVWKWRPVTELTEGTATDNHVLSITQRQDTLQGRNRTVGVLTVSEALVSGAYRCVASSAVGEDEMDILFYVTDVPEGFVVQVGEESTEGGDLNLSCSVSRHLYSALSWHKVTDRSQATPQPTGPALGGEEKWGEFSRILNLLLSNLTMAHSGMYQCSARHLLTGERVHLETRVEVTALEAPSLLHNLSDCRVNVSTSVTLQCPVTGVPLPLITWYKDHRRLQQVSGIMMAPEGGALHIDRITVEDQGLYTCQATNGRGSVESSAYVWVEGSSEEASLEVLTLMCTCVVAAVFWVLLTLLIRKLKQPRPSAGKPGYLSIVLDPGEGPLTEQCDRLQFDPAKWEFPRDRLKLEKPLGQGAFGRVLQASAFGIGSSYGCTTVAVKMLKEGATPSEHKALMTELKIFNHIGHHLNVVNLLGACTKPGGPLMVIVEYCRHGNLSAYLKSKRELFLMNTLRQEGDCGKRRLVSVASSQSSASSGFGEEREEEEEDSRVWNSESPLLFEDLISYSFQVARGMEFLATRKCIHRDLAARNVLLSDNNVVKICDFGLARDIYKNPDYVRKGDARLPLKWMAPESIFDKVFTTQSDVWSFGILLWEIFSLGASPYPGLSMDEEFCHRLKHGTRMRPPEYSTPEIYNTMLACWEKEPSDRPTFTVLVNTLGDLLQAQVQQAGKDYIPLDPFHGGESGVVMQQDYRDTSQRCINTRGVDTIRTFEENPQGNSLETDSGMVLPSEELKYLKWSEKLQPGDLRKLFSLGRCRGIMGYTEALPCVSSSSGVDRKSERHIIPCDTE
ncbi:vascular endothelial growth factor receptor 1 isoform X1 [Clupea harengus]|uniref:receptor protein-tyrosine kinase n=1 Tax=Clupea harengus TaxID=7950 RepID=A0A6P3VH01_CLUHA|nr:vascular endothelial growth factor receptor 1 isoform X1 [Clupea harengus]